jgi:hypothetical protein
MSKEVEYICSLPQLQELADFWITQLQLEAWDIRVMFGSKDDLLDDDGGIADGISLQIYSVEKAVIKVLTQESHRKDVETEEWPFKQDMEVTLVHELLHLAWEPFRPKIDGSTEYLMWHTQLDRTAKLLVELKRHGEKNDEK